MGDCSAFLRKTKIISLYREVFYFNHLSARWHGKALLGD